MSNSKDFEENLMAKRLALLSGQNFCQGQTQSCLGQSFVKDKLI